MKLRISKEVVFWAVLIFSVSIYWLQKSLSAIPESGTPFFSLPPFLLSFAHWIHMGMAVLGVITGLGLFFGKEIFRRTAIVFGGYCLLYLIVEVLSIGFMSEKATEIFSTINQIKGKENTLFWVTFIIYTGLTFFSYFLLGAGSIKFFRAPEIQSQFLEADKEPFSSEGVKRRWSFGDFMLGLVFIFLAFSMLRAPIIYVGADATVGLYKHRGMVGRIEQLKEDADTVIKESSARMEFEEKLGDVQRFADDFHKKELVPLDRGELLPRHKIYILTYVLMLIGCMASALGLALHSKWARNASFVTLGAVVLYALATIYQFLTVPFLMSSWWKVLKPVTALLGQEIGDFPILSFAIQLPVIIGVVVSGLFIYLCSFYLTRPKVKERFAE